MSTSKRNNENINWINRGILWGIVMFIIMSILYPIAKGQELTLLHIGIGFAKWIVIIGPLWGLAMQLFMNRNNNKKDIKH